MSHRGVCCVRVCACTCCACILPLNHLVQNQCSCSLPHQLVWLQLQQYTEIFRSNPDSKPLLSDRGHLYSSLQRTITKCTWQTGEFQNLCGNTGEPQFHSEFLCCTFLVRPSSPSRQGSSGGFSNQIILPSWKPKEKRKRKSNSTLADISPLYQYCGVGSLRAQCSVLSSTTFLLACRAQTQRRKLCSKAANNDTTIGRITNDNETIEGAEISVFGLGGAHCSVSHCH